MVAIAFAVLAACVLVQQLPQLPETVFAIAALAFAVLLILWRPLRIPAAFVAAFSLAVLQAQVRLGDRLPTELDNAELDLVGVISSIPEQRGEAMRFEFDVETARAVKEAVLPWGDTRVRLSWYRDAPALRAGERWQLRVRLKRPWGMRNPGGFDYEAWLFQRGIAATGQVRAQATNQHLDAAAPGYGLARLRQFLHERIQSAVPVEANQGLIAAL
jgi:competence protein ComEC